MKPLLLFTLVVLFSRQGAAHQDFYVSQIINETTIRICTGFEFEEIEKIKLICHLIDDLRDLHNSCTPIHIDYVHDYANFNEEVFFLNIGKPLIIEKHTSHLSKISNDHGIILRVIDDEFPIGNTLRLIEYAIQNQDSIQASQRQYSYNSTTSDWIIYSIAPEEMETITAQDASPTIRAVNSVPYYQRNEPSFIGFTYFLLDEKYHIYFQYRNIKNPPILSTSELFQVENIADREAVVFMTKADFQYFRAKPPKREFTRHIMLDAEGSIRPHQCLYTGSEKILIRYSTLTDNPRDYMPGREALYLINDDRLINDLETFLNKN